MDDPRYRSFVEALVQQVRGLQGVVAGATSVYEAGDRTLVSDDGRTTLLPVALAGELAEAPDTVAPLLELLAQWDGRDGFRVLTAGDGSLNRAFNDVAEEDLQQAELFGLPIALVVLVLVFGAVVAAGLPILLALLAIAVAIGSTALLGRLSELSFFVTNMITMMGLAVGIDYSLLIVGRFREERLRGLSVVEAVTRAGATASRAVLFSGFAVVIALTGMLIVPTTIFRSLAAGAILAVIWTVLAALTLLPAVLRLLGDRVNLLRVPLVSRRRHSETGGGFWDRAVRLVMSRPWLSVAASAALLVALAAPYFTIKLGGAGAGTLPRDVESFQAFEVLRREFPAGMLSPTNVVIDGRVDDARVQAGIQDLIGRMAADPAFGPATLEVNQARDLALVSVPLRGEAVSNLAQDAVDRLREQYVPPAFDETDARVLVGGAPAENRDFFALVNRYTPIVFAFVLGMSFLLLLVAFHSLVVPAKAVLMNLLSVGASYGLLVLVFQHGIGNELFGFQRTERIEAWVPLFMFSVLFGLSMDYHVFLLSRIRERFDQTRDNAESVAFGLRSTAAIITGAALIMVTVFGSFAGGKLVMFQQMGFGLAVAVIIDATIVRVVLVPASMRLLGRANWYLPRWLQWLPDFRVEGAAEPTPVAQREPVAARA